MEIHGYFEYLRLQRARAFFVPLEDTRMNRGKSNIAWIEATMAGSVCIAPNYEEWLVPGIIQYDTKSNFSLMDCIRKVAKFDIEDLKELYEHSYDYIDAYLRLSFVNKTRIRLIESL